MPSSPLFKPFEFSRFSVTTAPLLTVASTAFDRLLLRSLFETLASTVLLLKASNTSPSSCVPPGTGSELLIGVLLICITRSAPVSVTMCTPSLPGVFCPLLAKLPFCTLMPTWALLTAVTNMPSAPEFSAVVLTIVRLTVAASAKPFTPRPANAASDPLKSRLDAMKSMSSVAPLVALKFRPCRPLPVATTVRTVRSTCAPLVPETEKASRPLSDRMEAVTLAEMLARLSPLSWNPSRKLPVDVMLLKTAVPVPSGPLFEITMPEPMALLLNVALRKSMAIRVSVRSRFRLSLTLLLTITLRPIMSSDPPVMIPMNPNPPLPLIVVFCRNRLTSLPTVVSCTPSVMLSSTLTFVVLTVRSPPFPLRITPTVLRLNSESEMLATIGPGLASSRRPNACGKPGRAPTELLVVSVIVRLSPAGAESMKMPPPVLLRALTVLIIPVPEALVSEIPPAVLLVRFRQLRLKSRDPSAGKFVIAKPPARTMLNADTSLLSCSVTTLLLPTLVRYGKFPSVVRPGSV